MKRNEMTIQYITKRFEEIAKERGIEVIKVLEKDYSKSLESFQSATVYEYTSPNTGELVTVVETGTGNFTDSIVLATVSVPRKLTDREIFDCVWAVEREY